MSNLQHQKWWDKLSKSWQSRFLEKVLKITRKEFNKNPEQYLSKLYALEKIDLSESHLRDISPISHLTQLKELNLNFNPKLIDIKPLKKLINLEGLVLRATGVKDITPLKYLTQLTHLSLENTYLEKITVLKYLTNLKLLNLSFMPYVKDFSPLAGLSHLEKLYMTLNPNLKKLTKLGNLIQLKSFFIHLHKQDDYQFITKFTALENLVIYLDIDNEIDLYPFSKLPCLKRLEFFYFGKEPDDKILNNINFSALSESKSLKRIEIVFSDKNSLNRFIELNELSQLEWLYFYLGNISFETLSQLSTIKNITGLTLGSKVENLEILKKLEKLEYLDFGFGFHSKDASVLETLPNLKDVVVSGEDIPKEKWKFLGEKRGN